MTQDDTTSNQASSWLQALSAPFGQLLWETASDAMALSDADSIVLAVNEAYCQLYSLPREQLVGRSFVEIFPAERREAALNEYRRVFNSPVIEPGYVTRVQRGDGSERVVEARIAYVSEQGRRIVMLSIISDISERTAIEETLREKSVLLERILATTPDLVYIYDLIEERNVFVNRNLLTMLGYSAEQVQALGSDMLATLIHPEDFARLAERHQRIHALPDQVVHEHDYRMRAADGSWRWLHSRDVVFSREPDGRARQTLGIAQDVTLQKQAAAEHQKFERQLADVQKIESMGMLAAGVAHDFNNMLAALRGSLDLAIEELGPVVGVRQLLDQALLACRRAEDLTSQLLAYAGQGQISFQTLDLNQIVAEMLVMLRSSFGAQISVRSLYQEPQVLVHGDASQLRQIVLNLITNAAAAIGEQQGQITVSVGVRFFERAALQLLRQGGEVQPGQYHVIEVSDNGKGIDEALQAQIFEPFFTTRPGGRGLGLAAVLGIVRRHAGAIGVASQPGRGTTFLVALPPTLAQPQQFSPAAPRPTSTRPSVLIIDDDDQVRQVIARLIERLGYQTTQATNGTQALAVLAAQPIDAVVMDLTMPPPNGATLVRLLRQERPTLPIVVTSGYSANEAMEQLAAVQPLHFAPKPVSVALLRQLLHDLLGHEPEA